MAFRNEAGGLWTTSSKWEEEAEVLGLTLYDLKRSTRTTLPESDAGEPLSVRISAAAMDSLFNEDLQCGVCMGVMENTVAVNACLHRLCADCLNRSLRMERGKDVSQECPFCRAKLASRRAGKADAKFDALVQLLTNASTAEGAEPGPGAGVMSGVGAGAGGEYGEAGAGQGAPMPTGRETRNSGTSGEKRKRGEEGFDVRAAAAFHRSNVNSFLAKQRAIVKKGRAGRSSSGSASGQYQAQAQAQGQAQMQGQGAAQVQGRTQRQTQTHGQGRSALGAHNKVWLKLELQPEWEPDHALLALCRSRESPAPNIGSEETKSSHSGAGVRTEGAESKGAKTKEGEEGIEGTEASSHVAPITSSDASAGMSSTQAQEQAQKQKQAHTEAEADAMLAHRRRFSLQLPHLRVPPFKTVLGLKRFLLLQLHLDLAEEEVCVQIVGPKRTVLGDGAQVQEVATRLWDANAPLLLHYSLSLPPSVEGAVDVDVGAVGAGADVGTVAGAGAGEGMEPVEAGVAAGAEAGAAAEAGTVISLL